MTAKHSETVDVYAAPGSAASATAPGPVIILRCADSVGTWRGLHDRALELQHPVTKLAYLQWQSKADEAFGELRPVKSSGGLIAGPMNLSTMTGILTPNVIRTAGQLKEWGVQVLQVSPGKHVATCVVQQGSLAEPHEHAKAALRICLLRLRGIIEKHIAGASVHASCVDLYLVSHQRKEVARILYEELDAHGIRSFLYER